MFSISSAKQQIADAATNILGVQVSSDWVEIANPKAGAHLALPCFRFAKDLGKSPADIAKDVAETLEVQDVAKIEAAGPYVNFWIDTSKLQSGVSDSAPTLLSDRALNGKTAIIEYLSPNLAKPLSIGHFRNALQGRAIALMYRNAGYKVITDNHVGDWGTVFGMWVVGFDKFSNDTELAKGGVKELGRVYVEMRKALRSEEGQDETPLADLVQEWLIKLEDNDEQALQYHKKFSEVSLADVKARMAELDVIFDYNLGESFFVGRGKEMIGELLESGDAIKNDDGSVIITLEEQGQDTPMLIQKSNGAALYHTSDIAAIEYREKTWNPDVVVYVVGMEQQFHFKQLFAANQKIGWSDAELIHHWYGLIEEVDEAGRRQKMSSRKNAVFMSDLLELAEEKARAIAPDEVSDADVKIIAHGALTFREFSASHTGNTVFDWESMFSLSGFSGPYVQYAAVRIESILSKVELSPDEASKDYDWSEHSDLLWLLSRYELVIGEATAEREYHKVAEFAYELARGWNRFYENYQVLGAEGDDKLARLWLASTIGRYLERSLYLLGIKIPSQM